MYPSMTPNVASEADQQVLWGPRGWRLCYFGFLVQLALIGTTASTGSMVSAVAAFLLGMVLIAEGVLVFFNVGLARRAIELANGPRLIASYFGLGRTTYFSYRSCAVAFAAFGVVGALAPWRLT
jgi:hypothetical protein